jgi:hypothetical protein
LRRDGQPADEDHGQRRKHAVRSRDGIVVALVHAVVPARDDVRDEGSDHDAPGQAAIECERSQRHGGVEQDRRDEQLRREHVDEPGDDDQGYTGIRNPRTRHVRMFFGFRL